eukprot:5360882-Karenia_brevis.AAC.1
MLVVCPEKICLLTRNVVSAAAWVAHGLSKADRLVLEGAGEIVVQALQCEGKPGCAQKKPHGNLACNHCLTRIRDLEWICHCNNVCYMVDLTHLLGAHYFEPDRVDSLRMEAETSCDYSKNSNFWPAEACATQ